MGSKKSLAGALAVIAFVVAAIALPGVAAAKDRNHDSIPDRWEKANHLSLKVNQANRDQDRDKLNNRQEFRAGLNPRSADTNGDGTPDGQQDAGTIASFDGTTLVINLFNGSSVTGTVDASTEVNCDSGDDSGDTGDGGGGDTGGDDGATGTTSGGDDGDSGGDDGGSCSTADLVVGAVVQEADLHISGSGAVFEQIDLASTTTTSGGGDD